MKVTGYWTLLWVSGQPRRQRYYMIDALQGQKYLTIIWKLEEIESCLLLKGDFPFGQWTDRFMTLICQEADKNPIPGLIPSP